MKAVSRRVLPILASLVVVSTDVASVRAVPQSDRRHDLRVDAATRRESEALVALADAHARGERVLSDFSMEWRHDLFKARPGTFVPFTLSFAAGSIPSGTALLYIRVQRPAPGAKTDSADRPAIAYETIFPVRLESPHEGVVRVRRGFAVPAGSYVVTAVLRESAVADGNERPRVAVLSRTIDVPNFWTGELATSTVILADRLEPLAQPVPTAELDEDPYAVGSHRIHPASGTTVNRRGELIVVFLVYNPMVGPDRHFDIQVDYHLFRNNQSGGQAPAGKRAEAQGAQPGEEYVTRTNPQRFNPAMMGPQFDPATGSPVLAGQAILLADFVPGEYRLGITVRDLLSRRTLSRDVRFTVVGS